MDKNFSIGVVATVISAVSFGFLGIFMKLSTDAEISLSTLLLIRFGIASLVLFLMLSFTEKGLRIDKGSVLGLWVMGLLYAIMAGLYFLAVQTVSPSLASLILYTYPMIVTLGAAFIERERITRTILIALFLSFIGLSLVLGFIGDVKIMGVLYSLGAALCYSIYIITGNRLVRKIPPLLSLAYISLFGTLIYLLFGTMTDGLSFSFEPWGWWIIVGIALISTVIAGGCFFVGVKIIGSARASILSTLEPVVTILASYLIFDDRLTWMQFFGGGLVLLSAVFIVWAREVQNVSIE